MVENKRPNFQKKKQTPLQLKRDLVSGLNNKSLSKIVYIQFPLLQN